MPRQHFNAPRLFLNADLAGGVVVALERSQANYLQNVLRLREGDGVLVFNGRDGEWQALLHSSGRKSAELRLEKATRPQPPPPDLDYLFAPLKQARLDYLVQKAVEMGAGRLRPVLTRHTQVQRLNQERVAANAIEAAEQCGILCLPRVDEPLPLAALLADWAALEGGRRIIFCDEDEVEADPLTALSALAPSPLAVLIGPEGGFAIEERELLRSLPFVTPIHLGPRILRADTAAVAALALVQAHLGDWRK